MEDTLHWTGEKEEKLKRLLAEGLTAKQIRHRFGNHPTINALRGKVHSLGLNWTDRRVLPEETSLSEPEKPPAQKTRRQAVQPARKEVDHRIEPYMCRYPIEPGKFNLGICGKTKQPGRDRCAEHLTAAYVRNSYPKEEK